MKSVAPEVVFEASTQHAADVAESTSVKRPLATSYVASCAVAAWGEETIGGLVVVVVPRCFVAGAPDDAPVCLLEPDAW